MSDTIDVLHNENKILLAGSERLPTGLTLSLDEKMQLQVQVTEEVGPGKFDINRTGASGKLLECAHLEISAPDANNEQTVAAETKDGKGDALSQEHATITHWSYNSKWITGSVQDGAGNVMMESHFEGIPPLSVNDANSFSWINRDKEGKLVEKSSTSNTPLFRWNDSVSGFSSIDAHGHSAWWGQENFSDNRRFVQLKGDKGQVEKVINISVDRDNNTNAQIKTGDGALLQSVHISTIKGEHNSTTNVSVTDAAGKTVQSLYINSAVDQKEFVTDVLKKDETGNVVETLNIRKNN